MKGFYQVTETIKNQLLSDVNVNTVTTGDITKIDLSKQTIFPLSHIIVNNVNNEDNVLRFNLSVLSMDIVDVSKEAVVDIFKGNDNEQDILNTQRNNILLDPHGDLADEIINIKFLHPKYFEKSIFIDTSIHKKLGKKYNELPCINPLEINKIQKDLYC